MALSKKNDFHRRLRSIKRHSVLALQPLIISLFIVKLWEIANAAGIHFNARDQEAETCSIIPYLAVAFSLVAAYLLGRVIGKYRKMVTNVLEKDEHSFMLFRDDRMPFALHLLLGAASIASCIHVGLIDYSQLWTGRLAVFSISFFNIFYWIILAKLDNPAQGDWIMERVPPHWLTQDVDDYFKMEDYKKTEAEAAELQPARSQT